MRAFEDRSDFDSEFLAAGIALVEADAVVFAFQCARAINDSAVRADATFWPNVSLNVCVSSGFVVEVRGGKDGLGHDGFLYAANLPLVAGPVKYNDAERILPPHQEPVIADHLV